jgi:hypothetical protein
VSRFVSVETEYDFALVPANVDQVAFAVNLESQDNIALHYCFPPLLRPEVPVFHARTEASGQR